MTIVTSRSVVGSASIAATSIFDTVANTAVQATKLVNSVGTSIDMFDTFVTTARTKQVARTAVDMHQFYIELHETTAQEIATRQRNLQQELGSDPQYLALYKEAHEDLNDLITSLKTPA